jgi:hypothetical protein
MDIDDSFCDEKVNQWLMEDFDQEDGLIWWDNFLFT